MKKHINQNVFNWILWTKYKLTTHTTMGDFKALSMLCFFSHAHISCYMSVFKQLLKLLQWQPYNHTPLKMYCDQHPAKKFVFEFIQRLILSNHHNREHHHYKNRTRDHPAKYICNIYPLSNHQIVLFLLVELYSWDCHSFKDRFPLLMSNLRASISFSQMIE